MDKPKVKEQAVVGSFPIYVAPTGKVYSCIAWAAQADAIEQEDPLLYEWYLFSISEETEDEVIYFGLRQGFGDTVGFFSRSEILSNPGVEINEDVRLLASILPPDGWDRIA